MAAIKSVAIMAALFTAPVAGSMDDLLSVVNTIEQRGANAELINEIKNMKTADASEATENFSASPVRQELLAQLRGAREAMMPKPSPLRQDILSELRVAREQETPKPSAVRQELLAELRSAREQETPKPSATRLELLAELRNAREQETPKPSATRLKLLAELRNAREKEQTSAKPVPSPVRNELLSELRAAREEEMLEKFLEELDSDDEPVAPAPVEVDLPWDDSEILIENKVPEVESSVAASVQALNRVLRTLVLSLIALGLAAAAKLPELSLKQEARAPGQWVTLGLFFAPLLVVSADYAFDIALGNEFGIIAACWGLAGMAAVHLRLKEEKVKAAE